MHVRTMLLKTKSISRDGCPQLNISKMADDEFQLLTRNWMEAAVSNVKLLTSFEVSMINERDGSICLSGECSVCGTKNNWVNVRLFKPNFIVCQQCGQQFNPPLMELFGQISRVTYLGYWKSMGIRVWGMTIMQLMFSQFECFL